MLARDDPFSFLIRQRQLGFWTKRPRKEPYLEKREPGTIIILLDGNNFSDKKLDPSRTGMIEPGRIVQLKSRGRNRSKNHESSRK